MAMATGTLTIAETNSAISDTTMSNARFLHMAHGEYCGRLIVITVVPWSTRILVSWPLTSTAEVTTAISRFMDSRSNTNVLKLSEKRCITSVTITVCTPTATARSAKFLQYGNVTIFLPLISWIRCLNPSGAPTAYTRPFFSFNPIGHTATT